jgi:hypothetical protein
MHTHKSELDNYLFVSNLKLDGKQIVSASMEICIWQLSPAQSSWQLQQLWHNDYRLNFTDNTIHATDTAWQLLNVSNGTQTMSTDNYLLNPKV